MAKKNEAGTQLLSAGDEIDALLNSYKPGARPADELFK